MVGERIKQLREEKSLSQKELAKILSIGHSTLSCYEVYKRQVPNDLLIKLALYFEVSTDYLLGIENEDGTKVTRLL